MNLPPLLPFKEAQSRLLALAQPLPTEIVAIEEANGRYLSGDLEAKRTQPAADMSAMDGFAVSAHDCEGPWKIVGESAAGRPYGRRLSRGKAVRISTGAIMPAGAAAVLLQENAKVEGDLLQLANDDRPTDKHVRNRGFDFVAGDCLLKAGVRLGPAQIAVAIAGGHHFVPACRLSKLAIIESGDELAAIGADLAVHQIPASNGAMLASLAAGHTSSTSLIGPIADDRDEILGAFNKACALDADVIVTIGGASVGDHDLVRPALEKWGAKLDFWRIAMKPGKPLLVARMGRRVVLGLPGNPASAFVTGYLFLLPLLRQLAGSADVWPRAITLPLADELPQTGSRLEFVRGQISPLGVIPIAERDSSAQVALSSADLLIKRNAHAAAMQPGEVVEVYLLQNGGIA